MRDLPFVGAAAVAAGTVSWGQLRGPRFRRLFSGIYVRADVPVDLALRSLAASLVVRGRGVLAGWSAAELLGASCGPGDAQAEVIAAGGGQRSRAGLVVRMEQLCTDEVTAVCGTPVTTPLRTAYDLARRTPVLDAVIGVDALCHAFGFDPGAIRYLGYRHLGARGSAQLGEVIRRANRLAESPMETRIRVAIDDAGLIMPTLQHVVGPYRLDMAYPDVRLAVEYDGREHLTQDRAMRDLQREAYLTAAGWKVLRFRASDVMRRPRWVAAKVRGELVRRGMIALR